MNIKPGRSKRIIAIAVTFVLLLGVCFTGMLSASADSLTDGLTQVAAASDDVYTPAGASKTVTDIEGGGINYSVTKCSSYFPYVNKNDIGPIFGNGVLLQFSDYVSTTDASLSAIRGYRQFLIGLANDKTSEDQYKFKTGVAGILFDTVASTVQLAVSTSSGMIAYEVKQTIIAANAALEYDNFTGKPFSISLTPDTSGNIDVSVVINGGTPLTGVIDKAVAQLLSVAKSSHTYITVGGVDNDGTFDNVWSINYYGYKLSETPEFAKDLTGYATMANNDYTSGSAWIDNNDYNLLGGGIRYSQFQLAGYAPWSYNVNMGGYTNNFELVFSNYFDPSATTDLGHGHFLLILSSSHANDGFYKFKANTIGIDIDTVNGKVDLVQSTADSMNNTMSGYTVLQNLIDNDAFLYENFSGKPFTYTFKENAAKNGINLTITVGTEKYTASDIAYTLFDTIADAAFSKKAATATSCFISFGGMSNDSANQCYVTFYGYKTLDVTAPVIDGITDGGTYCITAEATVTDTNLDSVTVNGVTAELDNGKLTLSPSGSQQTIIATDTEGNSTTVAVTVYEDHDWDDGEVTVAATASQEGVRTFTCTRCAETRTEPISKLAPSLIEGQNGTWQKGGSGSLTFKSNAAFSDFIDVSVDGTVIDSDYYDVSEGSIVVTLTPEYLETLDVGTHTIEIHSASGTASTEFEIEEENNNNPPIDDNSSQPTSSGNSSSSQTDNTSSQSTSSNNLTSPKTGDTGNWLLWSALFFISVGAVLAMGIKTGKKKHN